VTGFFLAQAAPPPTNGAQLVLAALIGIAVIVVLITRYSVHPFLSLTIGSLVTAAGRASTRRSPATRPASAARRRASAP